MSALIWIIVATLLGLAIYVAATSLIEAGDPDKPAVVLAVLSVVLFSVAVLIVLSLKFSLQHEEGYNKEWQIKCRTISGEFSEELNACYKNGVKVNFPEED